MPFVFLGSKNFCEGEEDKWCESDDSEPALVEEKEQRAQEDKENVSPVKKVKRNRQGTFLLKPANHH